MADSETRDLQSSPAASTPESHSAAHGRELKAPKDRNCPFCGQALTSSSLGRHLDLYIKPKEPKPAGGIHDVDEIRKIRGGITRRQPRTSLRSGEKDGSVHNRGESGNWSRHEDSERAGKSTHFTEDSYVNSPVEKDSGMVFNTPVWQATGVINCIATLMCRYSSRWELEVPRCNSGYARAFDTLAISEKNGNKHQDWRVSGRSCAAGCA